MRESGLVHYFFLSQPSHALCSRSVQNNTMLPMQLSPTHPQARSLASGPQSLHLRGSCHCQGMLTP